MAKDDKLAMQPTQFQSLRDQAAAIKQADNKLGLFLENLLLHLGHLHGFDPEVEDAKAQAAVEEADASAAQSPEEESGDTAAQKG